MGVFYKMAILSKFHTMKDITEEDFNNYINFYANHVPSDTSEFDWFLFFFILLYNENDVVIGGVDFPNWYEYVKNVLSTLSNVCPINDVDIGLCEATLALKLFPDTNWKTVRKYDEISYDKLVSYRKDVDCATEPYYFFWHEINAYLMVLDANENPKDYEGLYQRIHEQNVTRGTHQFVLKKYSDFVEQFDAIENS